MEGDRPSTSDRISVSRGGRRWSRVRVPARPRAYSGLVIPAQPCTERRKFWATDARTLEEMQDLQRRHLAAPSKNAES